MDEVKPQALALTRIYHRQIAVLHTSQPDKPQKRAAVSPRPGPRNVVLFHGSVNGSSFLRKQESNRHMTVWIPHQVRNDKSSERV